MPLLARYNESLLRDRYEKLPHTVKEALFSAANAQKMFEIGEKYDLPMQEISYMAEETGYAILGFTKPAQFMEIIKMRLHIPQEKAGMIAKDIESSVLFPLQEALKEAPPIHDARATDTITPGTEPVAQEERGRDESGIRNQESRKPESTKDISIQGFSPQNTLSPTIIDDRKGDSSYNDTGIQRKKNSHYIQKNIYPRTL